MLLHRRPISSLARTTFKRTFTSTRVPMVESRALSISAGENEQDIVRDATNLVDHGPWQLCLNGAGLEREFKFKTFKTTWSFMNDVAQKCKAQKHHPAWSNVFNRTTIRWTTHSPKGLSGKDTYMARLCDETAERYKELAPDPVAVEDELTGAVGRDE